MAENKKEFNLSKKEVILQGELNFGNGHKFYQEEDVKEFIRLLKKEAKEYRDKDIDINFALDFNVIINKLAGKSLI